MAGNHAGSVQTKTRSTAELLRYHRQITTCHITDRNLHDTKTSFKSHLMLNLNFVATSSDIHFNYNYYTKAG